VGKEGERVLRVAGGFGGEEMMEGGVHRGGVMKLT